MVGLVSDGAAYARAMAGGSQAADKLREPLTGGGTAFAVDEEDVEAAAGSGGGDGISSDDDLVE